MKDYHINIFYSETDRGYIADIPDQDACSAFGEAPAETLKQADFAKRAWLAAARAERNQSPNRAIALPSVNPAHKLGGRLPGTECCTKQDLPPHWLFSDCRVQ